jgi:hypothetical protein
MKTQDESDLKWVGVDLHVHTPASKDYRGNKEDSEYLNVIRKANEFGAAGNTDKTKKKGIASRNPIGCVAFTDHNSVEGFRKFRQLQEETEKLAKGIRGRDPENSLVSELEKDLETLRSVRVLMGVEIKADPGIHMLLIFAESVEPAQVIKFLETAYQSSYFEFSGDPTPTTRWTLKETLDKIYEEFADAAFVVFPHVDSSGGVYEDLKDFQQTRIAALTHPVVKSLSFNRQETRTKLVQDILAQPAYRRSSPLSLIQSSDFHGEEGAAIGQPRTEILVRDGKPTFKNLKESFRETSRVKCSIDFVEEEYQRMVKESFVAKFLAQTGQSIFKEEDFNDIAQNVCAMLNSKGGIVELECTPRELPEGQSAWSLLRVQLTTMLNSKLKPSFEPSQFRPFQFSPGRLRILVRIPRSNILRMANDHVYTMRDDKLALAEPREVELIVSKNLSTRYAGRFETTLKSVARESTLLSKLPRGIPILLSCRDKLALTLPEMIRATEITPASDKGAEVAEIVDDLIEREIDLSPFGKPDGNTTVIQGAKPPREREHYLRFTIRRADVPEPTLQKCSWGSVDHSSILIHFGGGVGLVEPGYIISDTPATLLQPEKDWTGHEHALLGWFKSSFVVWYCAAFLGSVSPFIELQFRPFRIPIPRLDQHDILNRLKEHSQRIIALEMDFMGDLNRLKKKGTLDGEYQEKARRRHNLQADKIMLALDKEVFEFLRLEVSDTRFIAKTIGDLEMSDFGLLEALISQDDQS